jgi:hypothetical protein
MAGPVQPDPDPDPHDYGDWPPAQKVVLTVVANPIDTEEEE